MKKRINISLTMQEEDINRGTNIRVMEAGRGSRINLMEQRQEEDIRKRMNINVTKTGTAYKEK